MPTRGHRNYYQAIQSLQSNPGNTLAQAALTSSLNSLLTATNSQSTSAQTTQGLISGFAASLMADATEMNLAIAAAEQLKGYDAGQIANLRSDMANLQNEIATWNAVITASAIGAGVSLFLGAVLAVFTFGAGIAIGVIGLAAGITLLIVADSKVNALTNQVQADLGQMNTLNSQIGALTVLESNLSTLIALSGVASTQEELLSHAWQALEDDISAVNADLNQAQLDVSNLTRLQGDLNQANSDWQTLQSFATTMASIQYNTATPATATLSGSSNAVAA